MQISRILSTITGDYITPLNASKICINVVTILGVNKKKKTYIFHLK